MEAPDTCAVSILKWSDSCLNLGNELLKSYSHITNFAKYETTGIFQTLSNVLLYGLSRRFPMTGAHSCLPRPHPRPPLPVEQPL